MRATGEIHLLSTWDEGVPEEIPHDHLYGITWNPMNFVRCCRASTARRPRARVGTDALSPLFAQLLPMAFPDAELVDGGAALRAARRIKTADEVDAIRAVDRVAERAMAAAVAELRPGVSERAAHRRVHGRDGVARASPRRRRRTSPGSPRASTRGTARAATRASQPGDLVAFDAGVVADGYAGEVGRTWPVGDVGRGAVDAPVPPLGRAVGPAARRRAGPARRQRPARRLRRGRRTAARRCRSPAAWASASTSRVIARDLPATAAEERLDPGMVLALTGYVWRRGRRRGRTATSRC